MSIVNETSVPSSGFGGNSTASFPDFAKIVTSGISWFQDQLRIIALAVDRAAIVDAEILGTALIIVGLVLWFGRLNKHWGKDLTLGGAVLIGLALTVFQWLTTLRLGLP